jgi:hypothetical protein
VGSNVFKQIAYMQALQEEVQQEQADRMLLVNTLMNKPLKNYNLRCALI